MIKKELVIIALFFLALLGIFFSRLFLPEQKIFITPDFGRSDIFHLNYALKDLLSDSLKRGELPLWTDKLATGFSTLGEGQIGMFNVFNLFFFGTLPMPYAYNISIVFIFLIAAIFTFFFARLLGLSNVSATISALVFGFSGFMIAHIQHFNLVQTAAFLPAEFFLVELFIKKRNLIALFFLPIVISQQYFSGFPQVTIYSLITITIYTAIRFSFLLKRHGWQENFIPLLGLSLSFLVGLGLCFVQLLPSREFLSFSTRSGGADIQEIFRFPFRYRDLLTFLNPFAFGSPKYGTYPKFSNEWGIFWENTFYVGIVPLILLALGFLFVFKKNKYRIFFASFFIILFISIFFSLGKFSPTFFLFTFPPLNLFRVPSRFLMSVDFSIAIIAGLAFQRLSEYNFWQRRINFKYKLLKNPRWGIVLGVVLIAAIILNSFLVWFTYHPVSPYKTFLATPQTATFLTKNNDQGRILSLFPFYYWNQVFIPKGWEGQAESYQRFLNSLDPNMNLIFGISQSRVYESLLPRRYAFYDQQIQKEIFFNEEGKPITIGQAALKLLKMQNVKFLIAPKEIASDGLKKVFQTNFNNTSWPVYYIYQLEDTLPRFYTVGNVREAKTLSELVNILISKDFDPRKEAIVEKPLNLQSVNSQNNKILEIHSLSQSINLAVDFQTDGPLVMADSFYPGWQAKIDENEAEILAANLNQRVLNIPSGKHRITLSYRPQAFKKGLTISVVTFLIWSVALYLFANRKRLKFL